MTKQISSSSMPAHTLRRLSDTVSKVKQLAKPHSSAVTEPGSLEDILAKLVAFPTVTGHYEANHEALAYIDSYLQKRGMRIRRFEWNGFESVVATTKPTMQPKVLLSAHLDVVPAGPELFAMREQEGKYVGRGVFDMKFAIAAYLQLVDEIAGQLDQYDFGIMITTDEEVGGDNGVERLVNAGYVPNVCIIPDGGDNWDLEVFAKGLWHITISTNGKSAHGSRPWEGDNAIGNLLAVLQEIQQLFPNEVPDSNTLNIGIIQGGKATNQIADHASAGLDVRFISKDDEKRLRNGIESICARHAATLTTDAHADLCYTDPNNPYLQSFAEITEAVVGYPAGRTSSYAATDGRFFTTKGVPCVITRPPGGNHHGAGEWIEKEGLQQLHTILRKYLEVNAKVA